MLNSASARFWSRNRTAMRTLLAVAILASLVVLALNVPRLSRAYRNSRPRDIAPLGRIEWIDVAFQQGTALRISDSKSTNRLRSTLNSRVGRWQSPHSFIEALLPVEGTRVLDVQLSISTDSGVRVFEASLRELGSEGVYTSIDEATWRELVEAVNLAPDGEGCAETRPLTELGADACAAESFVSALSTICDQTCRRSPQWIAMCPDTDVNVVLVSEGHAYSRIFYTKGDGRLIGVKNAFGNGKNTQCYGTAPSTHGCIQIDASSCKR
jgi:hypothetical protein